MVMDNSELPEPDFDDLDEYEESLFEFCPFCGREFDEIDYEYQICHFCKHDATDEQDED
jgi:hypothetical protein